MKQKTAVIYTRVSTDVQAEKGFSLRDQLDKLQRHCLQNNITILKHFQEDYSAKDFNRPEWKALMQYLKKNKHEIDLFMFAKWDRFSRNMNESVIVLNLIKSFGIEIYCLENNVDDSIPENKVMQMLMLLMPQVENERRSLNVIAGMRRAMKEGKWPRHAPVGYKNVRDESNNKIIVPDVNNVPFIKKAFDEMAKGEKTQQEVRQDLIKMGFKCSKNNFSVLLRNPFYIGKISIPKYKNEPAEIVTGIHQTIIDKHVFYQVQNVLSSRNKLKNMSGKKSVNPNLPLRGFVLCHNCGQKLTGSYSKGNGGRYLYYHCNHCGRRFRADMMNEKLEKLFAKFELKSEIKELFLKTVKQLTKNKLLSSEQELSKLNREIENQAERKQRLEDSFLDGQISGADYSKLNNRLDDGLQKITIRQQELQHSKDDFNKGLLQSINTVTDIGKLYEKADITGKQRIIGSIFPRKFIFEENKIRTDQINEVVSWIVKSGKALEKNKKGQPDSKIQLSCLVAPTGIEPVSKV